MWLVRFVDIEKETPGRIWIFGTVIELENDSIKFRMHSRLFKNNNNKKSSFDATLVFCCKFYWFNLFLVAHVWNTKSW